jgi:hypothetical protein
LGPVILIPSKGFLVMFLAFLEGFRLIGAFRLQGRVLEALALELVEGSLVDSAQGSWVEIGMAGIGMSPSNLGIGEMTLSKTYIQEIKI